jgi:hypothetical protein
MVKEYLLVCTKSANFSVKSVLIPIDLLTDDMLAGLELIAKYGEEIKDEFIVDPQNKNISRRSDKYKEIHGALSTFEMIADESPVMTIVAIDPIDPEIFFKEAIYITSSSLKIDTVYRELKQMTEVEGTPIKIVRSFSYEC